jgi:hypothetical protein
MPIYNSQEPDLDQPNQDFDLPGHSAAAGGNLRYDPQQITDRSSPVEMLPSPRRQQQQYRSAACVTFFFFFFFFFFFCVF